MAILSLLTIYYYSYYLFYDYFGGDDGPLNQFDNLQMSHLKLSGSAQSPLRCDLRSATKQFQSNDEPIIF